MSVKSFGSKDHKDKDDSHHNHSQRHSQSHDQSVVVRKFEELKQSIQLNNSIQQMRQSQTLKKKGEQQESDGNRPLHTNEFIQATNVFIQTENDQLHELHQEEIQEQTTNQIQKIVGGDKIEQQKRDLADKVDHKISLIQLKQKYNTNLENGMDEDFAQKVLLEKGENKLTEKQKESALMKLFKELTNGFALMLWVSGILCFLAYGLTSDDASNLYLAIVILIVISLTAGITFQQNAKSEALMNSFKSMIPQKSNVVRNGEIKQIEAIHLVVGDVVLIKSGDKIPADLRIIESNEMKVDNSPLTGESEPLLRTIECSHPDNYLETSNIAFFGTLCKEGTGRGVVICTGDNTTLGQIADLTAGEKQSKTPLRTELDRFVVMMTVIAFVLGGTFFLLAYYQMGFPILSCIVFGIGILVANVPEGLLGCITISLSITAKNLSKKNVLVKNLEAVETLGSTSCICSDKTGTLTQNVMTVKNIWIKDQVCLSKNLSLLNQGEAPEYDINDPDFKILHQSAMICSEARFDTSTVKDHTNIDYMTCPVIGDATETGLIRFFQYIEDVNKFRSRYQIVQNSDKTIGKMPFNSQVKFALTVVEEKTENSEYSVYIKGAPEKIWSYCSTIINNGQPTPLNDSWEKKFNSVNLKFGKGGERVLGFARLQLPDSQYPKGTYFNVSSLSKFPFKLANFQFCGLISLMDPPKTRVPNAILECRSAGIKVIMVTGDQPPTAAAIARDVNIIPRGQITNEDLMEADPTLSWFDASEKCQAIVVHGDRILESIDKSLAEHRDDQYYYLRQWIRKPYCVFARTTPAQKLQIVESCQKEGYIVAATGDGVNDSPAIKKADIGISMNISGSDVTKDAADMILIDDDFASIMVGVEEGRKIFDNLKKNTVYLLTSNMTEIVPFLAFIIFELPLPLSSIYMLILQVGTDIWPAISLAYEDAEIDIMTRLPRKKDDHLVSNKLVTVGYLQTGQIASAAGFLGYYVCFNYFGFPVLSLQGLASSEGYRPPVDDFKDHINPYTNQVESFYNSKLHEITQGDCRNNKEETEKLKYDIDWSLLSDGNYDLRKAYVKCDETTGQWVSDQTWSYCDIDDSINKSPVTNQTTCYSTEAIKWAQSCYFVCVVFVQWSNIFACKSRIMSYTTTYPNKVMFQGIIFETALTIFLQLCPGVQDVFGGRPLPFWLFGIPAFSMSMFLLIWDETRKMMTRRYRWFLKYTLW